VSPLRQGHLAAFLFRFADENQAYARLGRRILRGFAKEKEFLAAQAFLRVLSSMEAELSLNADFKRLDSGVRLRFVWAHASNVFRILATSGVDLTWIKSKFGREVRALPDSFLHQDDIYSMDVAHPSRLGPWRFAAALAYYASSSGTFLPPEISDQLSQLDPRDAKKSLEFISDTSLWPNSVPSFLAKAFGWPKLFSGAVGEIVTSTRDASNAVLSAQSLLAGNDSKGWIHLQAVLGESPISEIRTCGSQRADPPS
jgi:hypothetical protein